VKGIAYEWGIPVLGVSTLLANAARVTDHEGVVCSLLDARKQEVYAALFDRRGQSLTPLAEERVCSINAAITALRATGANSPLIIGDGAIAYRTLLTQSLGQSARICAGDEFGTLAAQVAALAWPRLNAGEHAELASLAPRYLRASEAEKKPASQV
jgi:tRNA threonylcarbamoyladenosine biosynthesis protein TsaB